jgi:hypothetical protein
MLAHHASSASETCLGVWLSRRFHKCSVRPKSYHCVRLTRAQYSHGYGRCGSRPKVAPGAGATPPVAKPCPSCAWKRPAHIISTRTTMDMTSDPPLLPSAPDAAIDHEQSIAYWASVWAATHRLRASICKAPPYSSQSCAARDTPAALHLLIALPIVGQGLAG